MSVNSKMTAIADKIRSLLGITGTMGLDAMATNLGTEQTNIANAFTAVGNKGGTVPSSKISGNLASAISSIPDAPEGVTVQVKTGTVTISGSNKSVYLGWQPDAVFFTGRNTYMNTDVHAGVAFKEANVSSMITYFTGSSNSYVLSSFTVTKTSTGFQVKGLRTNNSLQSSDESNRTVNYIAIKYS